MTVDEALHQRLLVYQKNEITEHHVYKRLAGTLGAENRAVLEQMAAHELRHYHIWRKYTRQDIAPDRRVVWLYYLLSRLLGFTFGVKLLERWERRDQHCYEMLEAQIPEANLIRQEECGHEAALLRMLDERKLHYASSMVLGLSDALVELTGALAGLTLALQNTRLVALASLMTGIAAALSMAASEYLSTKAETTDKNPLRASVYTGSAYLFTVLLLVLPYLLLDNPFAALAVTLVSAVAIIGLFNFYISVAKETPFGRRFVEMAVLCLGVAAVSFVLGLLIRAFFAFDI
jgi:VIT1/CCC1 family predicted Fe2+/Mn2+ transporter